MTTREREREQQEVRLKRILITAPFADGDTHGKEYRSHFQVWSSGTAPSFPDSLLRGRPIREREA